VPSSKGASTSGMERRQVGRTNRWFRWVTSFAHTLQLRQNRYLGWPHATPSAGFHHISFHRTKQANGTLPSNRFEPRPRHQMLL